MQNNSNPIGFFDSGIGGTSIWKEVSRLLPNENTIYLADSKNAPYGIKSKKEIIELCFKNVDFLLKKKCKLIVVACNTATTNAIKEMRATYAVPFIGIEPAIKPAAIYSKTQKIGVLATKGTITSELFYEKAKQYTNVNFVEQIGTGLVELIENGKIESEEMTQLLNQYLQPMIAENIDYLVLGCSHYPYLIAQIQKILPNSIKIIDSGEAVAKQTKNILMQNNLRNSNTKKGEHLFFTNNNPTVLQNILQFSTNVNYLDF
ncbi:glutamate racemase [Flavobacterium sp.]|uniref:glutamate racemase n=1 Tax=Flavobacterium sp. TaxID=239 RepID=UPI003526D19D